MLFLKKTQKKIQERYKLYYGSMQIRKHGVWFIDIPRTSSTSIKTELGLIYGPPYGKTKLVTMKRWPYNLSRHDIVTMEKLKHRSNLIFDDHIPAMEMQKRIGEKLWNNIFTFAFVRNPWDRMLSLYFAMKKWGEIPNDIPFQNFILKLRDEHGGKKGALFRLPEHYLGSSDYIIDASGKIMVNFIGRFENRSEDLKIIAQKLGRTKFGTLVPNLSNPWTKNYPNYYDSETREIVRKLYKKDIELFDYKFAS